MRARTWLILGIGAAAVGCMRGTAPPRSACSEEERDTLAEGVQRLVVAMGNRDLAAYARTAEALEHEVSSPCAEELALVGRMERAHAQCAPDEERMLSRAIGRAVEAAADGDRAGVEATLRDLRRVVSPACQDALRQRFGPSAVPRAVEVANLGAEFVVADGSGGLVVPGVVHCDGGGCVGLR
jgi:hypothetical protein